MFFSALKYSKANWNGDDVVSGAFHSGVFFTEKAFTLLKSVEKETIRYGVVILK
jgi:major membrane immunogen (membrane-anchored lipoprotein)